MNTLLDFSQRKFGVEIEFCSSKEKAEGETRAKRIHHKTITNALKDVGIACDYDGYSHLTKAQWKLVRDNSCGWELVSPPMRGEDGFKQVTLVTNVLKSIGARVDHKCGLHVHVDTTSLDVADIREIILKYAKFESIIDNYMLRSRRGNANDYCNSIQFVLNDKRLLKRIKRSRSIHGLIDLVSNPHGRYIKVNVLSLRSYGTLEFRQHEGTIDGETINNWVKFCLSLVEGVKTLKYDVAAEVQIPKKTYNTKPSKRLVKLTRHLSSWSNCKISMDVAARRSGYQHSSIPVMLKRLNADYGWRLEIINDNGIKKILVCEHGIMPEYETPLQRELRTINSKSVSRRAVNVDILSSTQEWHTNLFHGMTPQTSSFYESKALQLG